MPLPMFKNLKLNAMKKRILAFMISTFSFFISVGQTLEDWANLDDKKFAKTVKEQTHNTHELKKFARSDEELPKLEKIGLLSFSIFDAASFQRKTLYSYESFALNELGGITLLDSLFHATFWPMNKVLKEKHNLYTLLPDNFNDTDEKKRIYKSTEFEPSKLFKATAAIEKKIRGGLVPDAKVDIPGLKRVAYANADPKIWRAVGKLAGELGLDAFLIIENHFTSDKKGTYLQAIGFTLVGPNTVPYREEDKKKYAPLGPLKGYLEGIMLGHIRIEPPKNAIKVITFEKKKFAGFHLDGIGKLYARAVDYLVTDTKQAYDKLRMK